MQVGNIDSVYIPRGAVDEIPLSKRGKVRRVVRIALEALQNGFGLTPISGRTINSVYELSRGGEIVGYLKSGEAENEATTVLERVAWKISLILGCSKYFTATIPLLIQNPSDVNFKFPLASKGDRGEPVVVTLQPIRRGMGMTTYINSSITTKVVSPKHLMGVTIAALTFGMWDWHSGNGVVNKRGKPKFFDNGRFLPNANSLMSVSGVLQTQFSFSLLDLPYFSKIFTPADRRLLLADVRSKKDRIPKILEYFEVGEERVLLEQIPEGWIEPERAVNAMEERLDKMEIALNDEKVNSLDALVCQVIPFYRFFVALSTIYYASTSCVEKYSLRKYLRMGMMSVGSQNLNSLLDFCISRGINPEMILQESLNKQLSLLELIDQTLLKVKSLTGFYFSVEMVNAARSGAINVMKKMMREACEELKDYGGNNIREKIHKFVVDEAKRYQIPITGSISNLTVNMPLGIVIQRGESEANYRYRFVYRDGDGKEAFKDAIFYWPSYFEIVGNEEAPPKLFGEVLKSVYPDFYFPNCTSRTYASHYLQGDGKWLLGAKDEGGACFVYYSEEGTIKKYQYFPVKGSPGMLVCERGRLCTLNQLEQIWSAVSSKVVRND